MKIIISPIFYSILIIAFCACNGSDTKKNDTESLKTAELEDALVLKCENVGNMIIDSTTAYKMKNHFNSLFRMSATANPKNALLDSFWIDGTVISQLGAFLDTSQKIDGVRIIMAANESPDGTRYPGQQYQHESKLIFLLTSFRKGPGGNGHNPEWSVNFPFNSTVQPTFTNFNMPFQSAINAIKKFGGTYREETIPGSTSTAILDSLSASVWIDKCVFTTLAKLINTVSKTLDGVNIYLGAYDKKDTILHKGQLYPNQTTVILVPTNNHTSDWHAVEKTYKILSGYGYNHGELCPTSCN